MVREDRAPTEWLFVELPISEYAEIWGVQHDLVAAKAEKIIEEDVVLCLEHQRVFTIGRRGGRENLKVADEFLEREGVSIVEVERGGDITYHGPGQLVLYPIVDLDRARLDIGEFITSLEEVMLETAAALGVTAERNSLNRGVWVGKHKLGNIGICVRRGISFHGLSLNVDVALEPFGWINPCGLQGIAVTSIERELSRPVSMDRARQALRRSVEKVFRAELVTASLAQLRRRMSEKHGAVPLRGDRRNATSL